jgi:hypothetical protein
VNAAEAGVAAGLARRDDVAFTAWLQNRASQDLSTRSGAGLTDRGANMLLAPLVQSVLYRVMSGWLHWQAHTMPKQTAAASAGRHLTQRDDEVLPVVDVHAGGMAAWPQQAVVVKVRDLLPLQTHVPGG